MTGPRPAPIPSVKSQKKKDKKEKHKHKQASDSATDVLPPQDGAVELAALETKVGSSVEDTLEEEVVLTDKEQWRLRLAQVSLRCLFGYISLLTLLLLLAGAILEEPDVVSRPHNSHPSCVPHSPGLLHLPLRKCSTTCAIDSPDELPQLQMIGNSVFQAFLCGVMCAEALRLALLPSLTTSQN